MCCSGEDGVMGVDGISLKYIDFKRFELFCGISKKECLVQDCRESFADIIYLNGTGVACSTLAMKIYKSEGATEYSDEEIALMKRFVEAYGSVALNDSFDMNIKEKEEQL